MMSLKNFFSKNVLFLIIAIILLGMVWQPAPANESTHPLFLLHVTGNEVAGVEGPIRVNQDDTVTLRWSAEAYAELHLHGYDIKAKIEPGATYDMVIEAHASGRFPITSHTAGGEHITLQYLEVYPR